MLSRQPGRSDAERESNSVGSAFYWMSHLEVNFYDIAFVRNTIKDT